MLPLEKVLREPAGKPARRRCHRPAQARPDPEPTARALFKWST